MELVEISMEISMVKIGNARIAPYGKSWKLAARTYVVSYW
jgi:hypothetical protein